MPQQILLFLRVHRVWAAMGALALVLLVSLGARTSESKPEFTQLQQWLMGQHDAMLISVESMMEESPGDAQARAFVIGGEAYPRVQQLKLQAAYALWNPDAAKLGDADAQKMVQETAASLPNFDTYRSPGFQHGLLQRMGHKSAAHQCPMDEFDPLMGEQDFKQHVASASRATIAQARQVLASDWDRAPYARRITTMKVVSEINR